VPEHKIRERFHRLFDLFVLAINRATTTEFWDNSGFDGSAEVARFSLGMPVGTAHWPA
jgi:predicted ABC-type ATPase